VLAPGASPRGPLELRVIAGAPPARSPPQNANDEIKDSRRAVDAIATRFGREDERLVWPIGDLGRRLWRAARFEEALEVFERMRDLA